MSPSQSRYNTINRDTKETKITLSLNIDGDGTAQLDTGVPFLDHMLTLFTVHGFFDLNISAKGDTEVDDHHTVEDIGICLGQAMKASLNNFKGICRYGQSLVPMDETMAQVAVDCSNRPHLHYNIPSLDQKTGTFDTGLIQEFLRALSLHGGLTLHVNVEYGDNTHHILEAIFKALGRALDQATTLDSRITKQLSSKGSL